MAVGGGARRVGGTLQCLLPTWAGKLQNCLTPSVDVGGLSEAYINGSCHYAQRSGAESYSPATCSSADMVAWHI